MTKNAEYILEIINNSKNHPTAEQIFLLLKEKNEKAVLATVYNNLSWLYGHGLIRKISAEGNPDRYDRTERHDHLICRCCGRITDVMLGDLTAELQAQLGVRMLSYDLRMNCICPDCQKKSNNAP